MHLSLSDLRACLRRFDQLALGLMRERDAWRTCDLPLLPERSGSYFEVAGQDTFNRYGRELAERQRREEGLPIVCESSGGDRQLEVDGLFPSMNLKPQRGCRRTSVALWDARFLPAKQIWLVTDDAVLAD